MSGAFNLKRRRRKPGINITSLIDVMFLLIIFFMVSGTFRDKTAMDVTLPGAATGAPTEMDNAELVVSAEGRYYVAGREVEEALLGEAITELLAKAPEASLVLRADAGADFGSVVRAMDIARQVGGEHLVIPTEALAPESK